MVSVSMLSGVANVPSAKASFGTIYIMPDGTVNGTTSIHTSDNVTYVLTADINNQSIVVQRNNIVIDGKGHTLQGPGYSSFATTGMNLTAVNNVTLRDTRVTAFLNGIFLEYSSDDVLTGNNIENNNKGIYFGSSNNIKRNSIESNAFGFSLYWSSTQNSISENNVTNNHFGIYICSSSNNRIYHNSFAGNTNQAYSVSSTNTWDNGYPSGGNYWSDYLTKYPNASEIDSSGIGNTPYVIDANNTDHYPLLSQHVIPEFQPFLLLPILMTVTLLIVVVCRKKPSRTNRT
jgi:parallel beta-helix repeat protein